jgi:hypothetical protein
MNYGLNSDGQALEGSQFKLIGGTESNSHLIKNFKDRGFNHLGSSAQLLRLLRTKAVALTDVHVLTATCGNTVEVLLPGKDKELSEADWNEEGMLMAEQVDQILGVRGRGVTETGCSIGTVSEARP